MTLPLFLLACAHQAPIKDDSASEDSAPPPRPAVLTSCPSDAVWVDFAMATDEASGEHRMCALSSEGDVCCKPDTGMPGDEEVAATRTVALAAVRWPFVGEDYTELRNTFLFLDDAGDIRPVGAGLGDAAGLPLPGGPYVDLNGAALRRADGTWTAPNLPFDGADEGNEASVEAAFGEQVSYGLSAEGVLTLRDADHEWTETPISGAERWVHICADEWAYVMTPTFVDALGIGTVMLYGDGFGYPTTVTWEEGGSGLLRVSWATAIRSSDLALVTSTVSGLNVNDSERWVEFREVGGYSSVYTWAHLCALSESGGMYCTDPALSPSDAFLDLPH